METPKQVVFQMSQSKLPPKVLEAADAAGDAADFVDYEVDESNCPLIREHSAFMAGVEWLWSHLSEQAGGFDEAAPTVENLLNTIRAITREVGTASDMQIFGFAGVALDKLKQRAEQSKTREAALRAELEVFKQAHAVNRQETFKLVKERDELRAEVDRLKSALAELQDGKETMSRFIHEKRMSAECERAAKLRAEVERLKLVNEGRKEIADADSKRIHNLERELAELRLERDTRAIPTVNKLRAELTAERERAAKLVAVLEKLGSNVATGEMLSDNFWSDECWRRIDVAREAIAEYKGDKA